tara:strand:+ start:600 stop:1916 length:1317 start_codon:yes stop_codon:yes gene_type:complete
LAVDDADADLTLFRNISTLDPSDACNSDVLLNLMDTSLGSNVPLTAAQAVFQAQEEGLMLCFSSSSTSGFMNVRKLHDNGRVSRPYRAEMRMGQHGVKRDLGCFSTAEEAALHVARARAQAMLDDPLLRHDGSEQLAAGPSASVPAVIACQPGESLQNDSAAEPWDSVLIAAPVETAPAYEYATSLSRPRGKHETLHMPALVPVSLPGPSGSNVGGQNGLQDQLALAANQMVLHADQLMDQRVLRHLRGKQAMRFDVCTAVLQRNETLVYGKSMSGYSQVRVLGDPGASAPLRFQACRVLASTHQGGARTTIPGEIFDLPELAASELAERLMTSPPASATAIAYDDVALNAQAQRAIDTATADGLYLPVDQCVTGYRGVIFNANKGTGMKPRKKPYQARLTEASTRKRVLGGRFGTAEEAALDRAKMLKSHPNKYKDP